MMNAPMVIIIATSYALILVDHTSVTVMLDMNYCPMVQLVLVGKWHNICSCIMFQIPTSVLLITEVVIRPVLILLVAIIAPVVMVILLILTVTLAMVRDETRNNKLMFNDR